MSHGIKWSFSKLRRGQKMREPVQGEFFATGVIRDESEALVREAVQNSLDASTRRNGGEEDGPVRVRLFLSEQSGALSPDAAAEWFNGAWPHFEAEGNGLHDRPDRGDSCPFLVFEDFSTTGLTGSVEQWCPEPGVKNPFYFFFRAEGQSGKSDKDRGRWGVGKFVFPRSSRVRSFFACTTRHDDGRTLIAGQSILRTHKVGNSHFNPDGWYGPMEGELGLPAEDTGLVDAFREAFSLSRSGETGLSVVVPYTDHSLTKDLLLEALIGDYFYSLMAGDLEARVATAAGAEIVINRDNLREAVASLPKPTQQPILPLIDLTEWYLGRRPDSAIRTNMPPVNRAARWEPGRFDADALEQLASEFSKERKVFVRVPVTVREKSTDPADSFFDIAMVRDEGARDGRPIYIREGIIVSDVRGKRARGVRAIVNATDRAIARFLGDAENPAHTQWQTDSSNFRGKYTYGPGLLKYVSDSVGAMVRLLASRENEENRTLLADFFSMPPVEEPEVDVSEDTGGSKGGEGPDIPAPPPAKPRAIQISRIDGGFAVRNGALTCDSPRTIRIVCAYDRRRGNPFSKYRTEDFDLSSKAFTIDTKGATLSEVRENSIIAIIEDPEFRIAVKGFDTRRDIKVDGKLHEVSGATD